MEQDIYYKGYKIKIRRDENYESPNDWDNDDIFLVYDHRQFDVRRKEFEPKSIFNYLHAKSQVDDNNDPEGDYQEEMDSYPRFNNYWIFPVDAYIHSGVHISLANTKDYPDRRWDVSTTGYILASKEDWTEVEDAYKAAESLTEEWNQYLSGEVYGFIIEKPNTKYILDKSDFDTMINTGTFTSKEFLNRVEIEDDWEQIDSCWGYYGEPETSGLLDEAKAEIDYRTRDE